MQVMRALSMPRSTFSVCETSCKQEQARGADVATVPSTDKANCKAANYQYTVCCNSVRCRPGNEAEDSMDFAESKCFYSVYRPISPVVGYSNTPKTACYAVVAQYVRMQQNSVRSFFLNTSLILFVCLI